MMGSLAHGRCRTRAVGNLHYRAAPSLKDSPIRDGDHIFATPLFSYTFRVCLEEQPLPPLALLPYFSVTYRTGSSTPHPPWFRAHRCLGLPPFFLLLWLLCPRRGVTTPA
jgi:hypothetical protein